MFIDRYAYLVKLLTAREAQLERCGEMLRSILPELYELNPFLAEAVSYLVSCHEYARDSAFPESMRSWLIARWDCTHLIEE